MSTPTVASARRRRADAGTVRVTGRDLAVFRWLADMKAIYETDLAALIASMPPAAGAVAGQKPSPVRVRATLRRWQVAGLADARKLVADRPRIVRLLREGAALVDVDGFRETAPSTAYHQCEVSRVRLYLEGRRSPSLGRLTHWESERVFRSDLAALGLAGQGSRLDGVHVPDGLATYEGGDRVAVEVERTVKAPARLARIVARLLTAYPVTLYAVASRDVRTAVLAAERTARAGLAHRQVSPDRIGELSIIDIPGVVS
jgi:hypothetical protein